MLIELCSSQKDLAVTAQDIVRLFYPEAKIILESTGQGDILLTVSAGLDGSTLTGEVLLRNRSGLRQGDDCARETAEYIPAAGDLRNYQKRLVKLALYRLLCRYTGTPPGPWGILTGIRPTKIVHRLMDHAWPEREIMGYLTRSYAMAPEKAGLLAEVASRQRPYLLSRTEAERSVSVYIGIPFCPTRCAYCSFPAYTAGADANLPERFIKALIREIRSVGRALAESGVKVQTVYIGGGTPTVLAEDVLAGLMQEVRKHLISKDTMEVTMEAGRPDTITPGKLAAARESGVTRLSVNPQSMNRETLHRIGRCHSPEQVVEAMAMARSMGYRNINMDIIAGLPGETPPDMEKTLAAVKKLKPDNLTVHTLAVKRASRLKEEGSLKTLPAQPEVAEMINAAALAASEMGMVPYYLYRQKKMLGPLENIGYARPDLVCLYNIQIIEERQTIIGLGGGAGSKFVDPAYWTLTSHYNPKDPETYIERIEEIIAAKINRLTRPTGITV